MATETVSRDGDAIICICGNAPHLDGFYCSDPDGTIRDNPLGPDSEWNGDTMTCYQCGRTFSLSTLAVIGQTSDVMLAGARLVIG